MPLPFQPKPLDADAAAFIARSGATDRTAVNAFVRGVKALGLWNNMVCWPLRSSQNAGFGDTVFSLGGLQTANGTRVNAPAWGTNGFTVANANQGVEITMANTTNAEQAMFAVGAAASVAGNLALMAWSSFGGSQNGMNIRVSEFATDIGYVQQTATATGANVAYANSTNFFAYSVSANTTNMRMKRFPSTQSAETALLGSGNLTNTNPLYIGRRLVESGNLGGTIPFASLFTKDIRSSWDSLYSLYKSTLGTGLGLP